LSSAGANHIKRDFQKILPLHDKGLHSQKTGSRGEGSAYKGSCLQTRFGQWEQHILQCHYKWGPKWPLFAWEPTPQVLKSSCVDVSPCNCWREEVSSLLLGERLGGNYSTAIRRAYP
jgi:hypothetical protein